MRLPVIITVLSDRVVPETTSITDTCVIPIGGCLLPVQAMAARSGTAMSARRITADSVARNVELRQSLTAPRGASITKKDAALSAASDYECERAGDRTRTGDVQLGKQSALVLSVFFTIPQRSASRGLPEGKNALLR